ncbi:hypothetical protein [Niabella hirudinis]
MYRFLRKYFTPAIANLLIILWYLALLALIFFLSQFPEGSFRYVKW